MQNQEKQNQGTQKQEMQNQEPQDQNPGPKGHVLIVGASGLVGSAAANSFIQSGWQVTTASRRNPEWVIGDFNHLTLDLLSEQECKG